MAELHHSMRVTSVRSLHRRVFLFFVGAVWRAKCSWISYDQLRAEVIRYLLVGCAMLMIVWKYLLRCSRSFSIVHLDIFCKVKCSPSLSPFILLHQSRRLRLARQDRRLNAATALAEPPGAVTRWFKSESCVNTVETGGGCVDVCSCARAKLGYNHDLSVDLCLEKSTASLFLGCIILV